MANLATRRGVEGQRLAIHTPLIHLTKEEIIRTGLKLGVDYGLTLPVGIPGGLARHRRISRGGPPDCRHTGLGAVSLPGVNARP